MTYDFSSIDESTFESELNPSPELFQQEQEEELGFWGTTGDIFKGIGRGFLGAVENTLEVGNIIPGVNYDLYETDDIIDPTESFAGSAIEVLVQFTAGFAAPGVGGLAWAGRLGKLTGLASRGGLHAGKVAKAAVKAQNADRKLTALALARGGEAIKYGTASAIAEFSVFDAHEQRLSNLLQEFPALQNPFFEWMAADEEDSEFEGRLKNMIEGIGLGFAIDGLLIGFKAMRAGISKLPDKKVASIAAEKKAAELAEEAASKGADDVVDFEYASTPDTVNSRTYYHGTGDDIAQENIDPSGATNADNLFGQGLYLTDDPQIAGKYAKTRGAGKGKKARVYEADLETSNLLDLETKATPDHIFIKGVKQVVKNLEGYLDDGALERILKDVENSTLAEIYEKLAKELNGLEISEASDALGYGLIDRLVKEGYDGLTHIGGRRAGKKDHNVIILLDPNNKVGVRNAAAPNPIKNWKEQGTESTIKDADEVLDEDLTPIERLHKLEGDDLTAAIDKLSVKELRAINAGNSINHKTISEDPDIVKTLRIAAKTNEALKLKSKERVGHSTQVIEKEEHIQILEASGDIKPNSVKAVQDTVGMAEAEAKNVRKASYFRKFVAEQLQNFASDVHKEAAAFAAPENAVIDKRAAIRFLASKNALQRLQVAYKSLSGEFGRALQFHQATPQKIPANLTPGSLDELLKDAKQIDEILASNGGLEAVQKEARKYMAAYANNPGGAIKLHSKKGGYGRSVIEYWMNAILSGPQTQAVNALSGVLTTTLAPIEKAIGRGITGDLSGAGRELKRYVYLTESVRDSLSMAGKAFKENKAQLDELTSSTGERGYSQSTITQTMIEKRMLESTLGVEAARWIAKAVGNVVTAPSRSLMTVDEFCKQMNYRSAMKAGLAEKAIADGITNPKLIAEYVHNEFNRIVDDGQFYTRQEVFKRATAMSDAQLLDELERQKNPVLRELGETAEPGGSLAKEDGSFNRMAAKSYYIDWEMDNISPLANKALKHARDMTFTTPLSKDRGTFLGISKGISNIANENPLVRLVVPFVRTPANIIQHVIDRTPLGALSFSNREGFNILRKELFSVDPLVKADAVGRLMTGSALLTSGYMLALNGHITGGGPSDRSKRKVLEDAGWKPYSVKVGDTYTSFRRLDPYSSFFGIMADVADIYANGDETTRDETEAAGMALLVAMAKNLTDKTYLTGMTRVSNALSNPDRFMGAWARGTIGSFVPNVLSQANRSMDDEQKDIRTLLDTIKSRLPYYSKDAPPRRNLFGEPVIKQGAIGPDFISPFDYSETTSDVLKKELAQIGHGFSSPRSEKNGVELRAYMNDSGQSAYDRWLELHGSVKLNGKSFRQALTQLMRSRDYKRLPYEAIEGLENSPRVREINKILSKYRAKAFSQMLREFPDVRQRDGINLLIKQARRTGRSYEELLALANQ